MPKAEVEALGAGGVSGAPVRRRSTEVVRYLRQRLPKPIVIIGVGRRLPFFSRLIDVMLERGLTVVVIGDISARNAVIGRNVAFFKVVLNSHVLTSFTAAFALIALMVDEVGKCLVDTEDEVHARIEGINDCFDALDELED